MMSLESALSRTRNAARIVQERSVLHARVIQTQNSKLSRIFDIESDALWPDPSSWRRAAIDLSFMM